MSRIEIHNQLWISFSIEDSVDDTSTSHDVTGAMCQIMPRATRGPTIIAQVHASDLRALAMMGTVISHQGVQLSLDLLRI